MTQPETLDAEPATAAPLPPELRSPRVWTPCTTSCFATSQERS